MKRSLVPALLPAAVFVLTIAPAGCRDDGSAHAPTPRTAGVITHDEVMSLLAPAPATAAWPPTLPDLPDLSIAEPQVRSRIAEAHTQLKRQPEAAERWGRYASLLDAHSFAAESIGSYAAAARLDPENFRWPYLLAIRLSADDPAASLSFFEKALALNDEYAPLHLRYGSMMEARGDSAGAGAAYRRGVELEPNNAHAHAALGRRLLDDDDFEQAKNILDRAVALDPRSRPVLSALAAYYRRTGDMKRARDNATRAAAAPPGGLDDKLLAEVQHSGVSSTAALRRILKLKRAGRVQEARQQLSILIRDNPQSAGARNRLGEFYLEDGEYRRAVEEFRAALGQAPDLVPARLGLALAVARTGRLAEARSLFEAVLADHPSSVRAHNGLGACLAQIGRIDLAAASFGRALELAPANEKARVGYGKTLYYLGDYQRSVETLLPLAAQRDRQPDQTMIDAMGHAGLALMMLGRNDEAAGLLAGAVSAAPSRQDLREVLASCLIAAGRDPEAVGVLEQGLRLDPGAGQQAMILARLLAASPLDDVRDGGQAVLLAERLAAATRNENPDVLGVLGCAYAETGRFKEAIDSTSKAIEIARAAGRQDLLKTLRAQLDELRVGRPCRQRR